MQDAEGAGGQRTRAADEGPRDGGRAGNTPAAEWIVAAVSTALVLAMLGYTLYEALSRREGPAIILVRSDSIVTTPAGHLVMFTLRNDGGETAAQVHVRGALERNGATVEESQATVDFVPVDAERSGVLQFETNPNGATVRVRVTGFDKP